MFGAQSLHLSREKGLRNKIGSEDGLYKSLYSSTGRVSSWEEESNTKMYGGIFNLEFSPDSTILAAACEKKTVLLFDPLSMKLTVVLKDAHNDCVNCVKFIDNKMFATCSDDTTIALWDVRNLRKKVRTLQGHSNWVKNIEYAASQKLLVTSGFDGSIYAWDVDSSTEASFLYQRVFHTSGLMRCRISPDASKLVMCTTGGYLIVIHNLDLWTLGQDLFGFKPNIYRLMQMGRQHMPGAACFEYLFARSRVRNRVELITDFPAGNEAEVLSSLQIHPQGWCALSRNISYDEVTEWTCVHDIQEIPSDGRILINQSRHTRITPGQRSTVSSPELIMREVQEQPPRRLSRPDPPSPNAQVQPGVQNSNSDVWEAHLSLRDQRVQRLANRNATTDRNRNFRMNRIMGINTGVMNAFMARGTESEASPLLLRRELPNVPSTSGSTSYFPIEADLANIGDPVVRLPRCEMDHLYKNTPRLLNYIEEPNTGKGFIKELCFSPDGRVICSPYGNGIRLLAFSDQCSEMSTLHPETGKPQKLVMIMQSECHLETVVSSKFNPRHCQLVSGCLNGRIVWNQPVF